eukprot:jgi/Mesvir1/22868/Mv20113-RA.1
MQPRRDRRLNRRQGTGRVTAGRGLFGTQGRRTGLLLKDNVVKDSDGLDNIDDFWASDIDEASDSDEYGILQDENMGVSRPSVKRREARLSSRRKGTGRVAKPRVFGRDLHQLPRLDAGCLEDGMPDSEEGSPERGVAEETVSDESPEAPSHPLPLSAAHEEATHGADISTAPRESVRCLMSPGEPEDTASLRRSLTVVDAICQIPTGGLLLSTPWWERRSSPAANASKEVETERSAGLAMETDMDVDGGSPGTPDFGGDAGDDYSDGGDAGVGDELGGSPRPTTEAPPPTPATETDADLPARELFSDAPDEAGAAEEGANIAGSDAACAGSSPVESGATGGAGAACGLEGETCGEDAGDAAAALTPPAPSAEPAKPRGRRDVHARLREQFKRRQSLAQLPRGARKRSRPLEYWRNEKPVFERKESTSLPTVTCLLLRSPDPLWPRTRARVRATQGKAAKGSHQTSAE